MYARFGSGDERNESTWTLLTKVAPYGRHLLIPALGGAAAAVIATLARIAIPPLVERAIDLGMLAGNRSVVAQMGLWLGVVVAIQYVAQAFALFWVSGVGERVLRELRVDAFSHLINLDLDYFSKAKTGVLVARMTSDIEALTEFAKEGAVNVLTSVLTVVGVTVALFLTDVRLALAVLGLVPLLILFSVLFRRAVDVAYRDVREYIGQVLGAIQEGLSGVRVVQAYGQEKRKSVEFGRVNQKYYEANVVAARAISVYFPSVDFLRTVGIGVILFYGGSLVLNGELQLGVLIAFLLYLNWFFEPIIQLSNVYNLLQAALASLAKLFTILDRESAVPEPLAPVVLDHVDGSVVFTGVQFGYTPEAPILTGFDLAVAAGERVAIVGATGAGKSTVAKLAVRWYDPDGGEVSLDGVPLDDLDGHAFRSAVVMVPQEGFLFSGTLGENLAYADPTTTDVRLEEVAHSVGLAGWIAELPNGLNTDVGERGSRLSSGERQLVAIGRALVADPAVIVLDEATSNLDPETEQRVEAALSGLLEGRTAIVIAHRLDTARRADRIVVMADGQIAEQGTHDELMALGGPYADLVAIWTSEKPSASN